MTMILTPGQSQIYNDLFVNMTVRNAVGVCSRGWGKSHLAGVSAATAVNELMQLDASIPNKHVYIIAPTYEQVTDIYHPLLAYQLGLESYAIKHSKDAGRFWFPRNVELRLVSYEAVERMRGKGAYYVVNDEVRDWVKGIGFKEAWQGVIQPCITTRWSPARAKYYRAKSPGRSLTISTPKGYDFLYELYNQREVDSTFQSYHFDYKSSPMLDPDEIERIKHGIDPMKFAREYDASFKDSGNNVFYCFDRTIHVRKDLEYFRQAVFDADGVLLEEGEDVHIGIDFNVGLQCSSAFALRGDQVHYLAEFQGHPDTDALAAAIIGRFWPHYNNPASKMYLKKPCKIFAYPDPSGRARKTSAAVGATDFAILEKYGIQTRARSKAPPIVDSVNAVNRMFKTAATTVHMYVAHACQGLIKSLERTVWVENNPDTAQLDKKEGVEHFSDSVRYPIEYLFPVRLSKGGSAKGKTF